MSYTTTSAVKTKLGITGSGADTLLSQLVSDADYIINSLLDIDGFDSGTATEDVRRPKRFSLYLGHKIYLRNFNVKTITKINGVSYTGVLGTDYKVSNSRAVEIHNLLDYRPTDSFENISVEYTYGYARTPSDTLPKDVELMARLLVVGMYQKDYPMGYNATTTGQATGGAVTSYKLGEESISFGGKGQDSLNTLTAFKSEGDRNILQQLLAKYRKSNVVY